jgi:hypothetical protein
MLSTSGWRMYHEFVCSPGLPWDCEKKCVLWKRFDFHRREAAKWPDAPTYGTVERRTW